MRTMVGSSGLDIKVGSTDTGVTDLPSPQLTRASSEAKTNSQWPARVFCRKWFNCHLRIAYCTMQVDTSVDLLRYKAIPLYLARFYLDRAIHANQHKPTPLDLTCQLCRVRV